MTTSERNFFFFFSEKIVILIVSSIMRKGVDLTSRSDQYTSIPQNVVGSRNLLLQCKLVFQTI